MGRLDVALWASKSNKQLDAVAKAVLNSVGLCDAEMFTWVEHRNMRIEEDDKYTAMAQLHDFIMIFFLCLVFLNLSKRLSESRSRALYHDLKKKVIPKGASMLGMHRDMQRVSAEIVHEYADKHIERYRQRVNIPTDVPELEGMVMYLVINFLWNSFEASPENEKRRKEFFMAILEVVEAGVARTNLLKLVEAMD